jgi:hypothetical protein
MFHYHENGCKKLNAYDDALHAWFIFNLQTKISFIFTQCTVDRYLHNVQQSLIEPLAEITKSLTYLEGQCLAYGGESPSICSLAC